MPVPSTSYVAWLPQTPRGAYGRRQATWQQRIWQRMHEYKALWLGRLTAYQRVRSSNPSVSSWRCMFGVCRPCVEHHGNNQLREWPTDGWLTERCICCGERRTLPSILLFFCWAERNNGHSPSGATLDRCADTRGGPLSSWYQLPYHSHKVYYTKTMCSGNHMRQTRSLPHGRTSFRF